MIDFDNLSEYAENNRIEAKRAVGGLPYAIWETYSAFANTFGGVILLGVLESPEDKTFRTVELPDPQKLVDEFWRKVSDTKHISKNILKKENVNIIEVGGHKIVAIEVPRARREDRPVYMEGDPFLGSYRRNGEGDYHCTAAEVRSMQRDSKNVPQDNTVLTERTPSVLNKHSVKRYRELYNDLNAGENTLTDTAFLEMLGAIKRKGDTLHPTLAGLLFFGNEADIKRELPGFTLEYAQRNNEWSGKNLHIGTSYGEYNLFTFYMKVRERLLYENKELVPSLCEAVANALIHADYFDACGLSVTRTQNSVIVKNSGCMREGIGKSALRNPIISKLFSKIGIGTGKGDGLFGIIETFDKLGYAKPVLRESIGPEATELTISFEASDKYKALVVELLTRDIRLGAHELAQKLELSLKRTNELLAELIADKTVVRAEDGRYFLCVKASQR